MSLEIDSYLQILKFKAEKHRQRFNVPNSNKNNIIPLYKKE